MLTIHGMVGSSCPRQCRWRPQCSRLSMCRAALAKGSASRRTAFAEPPRCYGRSSNHCIRLAVGACSAALADAVPQLSLGHRDGRAAAWRQRPGRHLCRARRKRSNDSDTDDEENEEVSVRDSRDPDLEDDDDDEEEDIDLGDARDADPTTRLFQMVKEADREEEDDDDDLDEDIGEDVLLGPPSMQTVDDKVSRKRRKRKPKAQEVEEEAEDDAFAEAEDELPIDIDPEEEIDLDAIMGNVFNDDFVGPEPLPPPVTLQDQRQDAADVSEDAESGALPEEEADLGPMEVEYDEVPDRRYRLGDLLEMSEYAAPEASLRELMISGIQNHALEVSEGDLYVCTQSPEDGGLEFVEQAIERGAVAIVAAQEFEDPLEVPLILVPDADEALHRLGTSFYNDPSQKMTVIAIAGSRGKTTTAWLVRGIYEELRKVTGMIGTIEYAITTDKMTADGDLWEPTVEDTTLERDCSVPFFLSPYKGKYEPPPTTPDSLAVQKVMAGMADRGATACVYEVNHEALEFDWTLGVDVDVAVYMGVTEEDVERVGDPAILLANTLKLFLPLNDRRRQAAVVNIDDAYHKVILEAAAATKIPAVTFSMSNPEADVFVDSVSELSMWGTVLNVATPYGVMAELQTTLVGRHNIPNVLAAVAVGIAITVDGKGVELKVLENGIQATEVIPGRSELIDEDQDYPVMVDAANTPESLSRLLDSVRETRPGRVILVFGCEGERNKSLRPFMGEIAHYKADTVILTNDNPRGEQPASIIADIVAGYPDEILQLNAAQEYPPGFLQDPGRIPIEALEFSWHFCYEFRRYVMEDRFTAIRWAIGTAQKKDIVVIAGKGHHDYQEWDLGVGGLLKGWFDDRVEARNALSKVAQLKNKDQRISRKELPWMEREESAERSRLINLEID